MHMYDYPSTVGNGDDGCAECKKIDSKKRELDSRYYSLSYTAEDYDRKKAKGSFKKDYPAANKLMESLLKERTDLVVDHQMQHAAHEASETEEEEEAEHTVGVPVI